MALDVAQTFEWEQIALIEAGTGTGKSMAYLVPALLSEGRKTVISTHTINLQEQLVNKDIPFLVEALGVEVSAVLVKGMNNYACLRKAGDAVAEKGTLSEEERGQIEAVEGWLDQTSDGTRSDLSFYPLPSVWERIGAEFDACSHRQCPFYKECFFFEARKKAEEAQLVIVNHHILLADLALKEKGEAGILPEYDHLIIDEAHHLEEVATSVFATEVSRAEMIRQLGRLASDKRSIQEAGKLPLLATKVNDEALLKRLRIDLPAEKRRLVTDINDTFHQLVQFFGSDTDLKLRLSDNHLQHPKWMETIEPAVEQLVESIRRHVAALRSLQKDVGDDEKSRSVLIDIRAIADRLEGTAAALEDFVFGDLTPTTVKWIESYVNRGFANLRLVSAALDVSYLLAERLFKNVPAVVLTSATLTTHQNFQFVRQRLGLTEQLLDGKEVREAAYRSPFAFEKQALLAVPRDMPAPNEPGFVAAAAEAIFEGVEASDGNAFVLFTSFSMLNQCYSILAERLKARGLVPMKQGETDRDKLLARFKETDRSVLFGTDSFWEGVDVVGEALRCVIIARLPFRVPTEPIIQARTEAIAEAGGNPFFDYTVPQAIVKFKQGIGRLIRHRQDRGCILCLDSRLLTKSYGRSFLKSLPDCLQSFDDRVTVVARMKEFYLECSGVEPLTSTMPSLRSTN